MDPRSDEGIAAVRASSVRVGREGDVVVVALTGEHDLASRDEVLGALDGALDGGLAVVVDLRDADFIDSVVAAVFLEARKKAKHRNLGLGVVLSDATDNSVRRTFELSTLTTVFAVYPSPEAAVTAVRAGFAEQAL
jgi:anti-anti-sigma factor